MNYSLQDIHIVFVSLISFSMFIETIKLAFSYLKYDKITIGYNISFMFLLLYIIIIGVY